MNKIAIDIVKTIALKFILPLPIRLYKNAIIPYIKRKPVNLLSFLLFIFVTTQPLYKNARQKEITAGNVTSHWL